MTRGTKDGSATGNTPVGLAVPGSQSLFESQRLEQASWAFTTRNIDRTVPFRIERSKDAPQAGDLVLARVDVLGHHGGLQLWSGRRRNLFPGDEIVIAYANRYAPSQFEARVPRTLGPCHLVAGGGVASKARSWHSRIRRGPTLITPVGFLVRPDGTRANVRDGAMELIDQIPLPPSPTIAVIGTAMDAGKTASAAFLAKGLTQLGLRVGFAKITGTGAGGDTWLLKDAGADPVLDFTDAGFASTYLEAQATVERILLTLTASLTKAGTDVNVIEVADGVLQPETAALLESDIFRSIVGGVIFTARDAMGAMAGVEWLRQRHVPLIGLAGVLTAAPLQRQEAHQVTGLPTWNREELASAEVSRAVIAAAEGHVPIHSVSDE